MTGSKDAGTFKEEASMGMSIVSEERVIRLEEKLGDVSESIVRLEEQGKRTHEFLQQHDQRGSRALTKVEKLEDRMDAHEAMLKVPMKWLTLLAKIAGALAAIYAVVDILRRLQ